MIIRDSVIAPFTIKADNHQYTVYEEKKSKETGKITESFIGHYSQLKFAVKEIAKLKTLNKHENDEVTLKEFLNDYREIVDGFNKIMA